MQADTEQEGNAVEHDIDDMIFGDYDPGPSGR